MPGTAVVMAQPVVPWVSALPAQPGYRPLVQP